MLPQHNLWLEGKILKVPNLEFFPINRGLRDGVCPGQKVVIYGMDSEELFDPDTDESLGSVTAVKGFGKVFLAKEKFSVIQITDKSPVFRMHIGDFVRPVV